MSGGKHHFVNVLQEFSIPLIAGVIAALIFANIDPEGYHEVVEFGPFDSFCADGDVGTFCMLPHGGAHDAEVDPGEHAAVPVVDDGAGGEHPHDGSHGTIKPVFGIFGHHLTLHFIINDIFMLFFFGIAAKEITESVLPGGALNPPSKAVNPLFATLGGVLGPVAVYFALVAVVFAGADDTTRATVFHGWGIPTATDIALAWLVARMVFGATHPAVNFLLLLAIADDAIGLAIIAIFYQSQEHPPAPIWLLLVLAGMALAYLMRRRAVRSWVPYVFIAGALSWAGLLKASLHPALALVPIVPFLPGPHADTGLFTADDEVDEAHRSGLIPTVGAHAHSALHNFEHQLKFFVDFGLFFFGLANAGVALSNVNSVTWIVLASLLVGKPLGIGLFSWLGNAAGFTYPTGMRMRHVLVAGVVAGLGLTVALFVAGEAFQASSPYLGPAKMGALASAFAALLAVVAGRVLRVKELDTDG